MNNPQETRSAQGTVNSVRLFLRTDIGNHKVCILVEGSPDVKIYSNFFKEVKSRVMIIRGKGKPRVIEVLKILSLNISIESDTISLIYVEEQLYSCKTGLHNIAVILLNMTVKPIQHIGVYLFFIYLVVHFVAAAGVEL